MTGPDNTPRYAHPSEDADAWRHLARDIFTARPRSMQIGCSENGGIPLQPFKRAAHSAGYRFNIIPDTLPTVETRGRWEDFLSCLDAQLLSTLSAARQALEKVGVLSFHVVREDSKLLESALKLRGPGWSGSDRPPLLQLAPEAGFHAEIARHAGPLGLLRLFLLLLNGEPIAMCIALQHARTMHLLKVASRPNHSRPGVAPLLLQELLEHCFGCDITRVQFHHHARQGTNLWCAGEEPCTRFEAFDASLAGALRWATGRYARSMFRRGNATALPGTAFSASGSAHRAPF